MAPHSSSSSSSLSGLPSHLVHHSSTSSSSSPPPPPTSTPLPPSAAGIAMNTKRSSSSIHSPPSHMTHNSTISLSNNNNNNNFINTRDSSSSSIILKQQHPHSHIHPPLPSHHVGGQQQHSSLDTTSSFISSVVYRLVQRLPFNSGMKLTTLEDDALIRSCVATLVTISQYQLSAVAKELINAMEAMNKSVAAFPEDQISVNLLQSQLLLLRIMTSCVLFQWRCFEETSYQRQPPEATSAYDLPAPWNDPPPLDDHLAKQILSVMTVTIRQAVAREERHLAAWAEAATNPSAAAAMAASLSSASNASTTAAGSATANAASGTASSSSNAANASSTSMATSSSNLASSSSAAMSNNNLSSSGAPASKYARALGGGGDHHFHTSSTTSLGRTAAASQDRSFGTSRDPNSSSSSSSTTAVGSSATALGSGGGSIPGTSQSSSAANYNQSKSAFKWDESSSSRDDTSAADPDGPVPIVALSTVNGVGLFVLVPGCPPDSAPFQVPSPGNPNLGGSDRPQRFKPLNVIGSHETGAAKSEHVTESVQFLTKAIYRSAAMVIFYLSSSNWPVVHARIRNRVAYLSTSQEETPNTADLRILESSNLDTTRMAQIFEELKNSFVHLRRSAQSNAALTIRRMAWVFIVYHTAEFANLHATNRRMEGGVEALFDQAFAIADTTRRKQSIWPMLTSLLLLCPDYITKIASGDARGGGSNSGGSKGSSNNWSASSSASVEKKMTFLEALRKGLRTSKLADISAVCCMDLCKAATYTPPGDTGLRALVADLVTELRERIFDPQKPIMNSAKQIELSLIVEGFVTSFCLDPKSTLQTIIPVCIADSSPAAFKVGFLRAVTQMSCDMKMSWNPQIESVYPIISFWLRQTFKNILYRQLKPGAAANGGSKSSRGFFKGGSSAEDAAAGRMQIIHAILSLWRTNLRSASHGLSLNQSIRMASLSASGSIYDPDQLLEGAMQADSILSWVYMLTRATHAPDFEDIHQLAVEVLGMSQNENNEDEQLSAFLTQASRALTSCGSSMRFKQGERLTLAETTQEQLHWLDIVKPSLTYEVRSAKSFSKMSPEDRQEMPRPAFVEYQLERTLLSVAFFLCICSANTEVVASTLLASSTVVDLREEARKRGDVARAMGEDWATFWAAMTDPSLLTTGRVARQKRIRALVRNITFPIPASLITWKECFRRWGRLTQMVTRPMAHAQDLNENVTSQWHNYTGFLCALGGCCLGQVPRADVPALPQTMLDASLVIPEDVPQLIDTFIQEMVDLLVFDSIWVREKVKDTLGLDLHVRLNGHLLRQIHAVLGDFFDKSTGLPTPTDMFTLFVEQAIAVVQQVLKRMETPQEWTAGVDIGSLMVLFVEYVNSLGKRPHALRIKTSMCQLCGALMAKKSFFAFNNELRVRNRLFQALITWTSESSSDNDAKSAGKIDKLQRDLDVVCLNIVAVLLDSLPLLLADDALMFDDKVEWAKARQFSLYSSYFINLLNRTRIEDVAPTERATTKSMVSGASSNALLAQGGRARELALKEATPLREAAILALSNLLASNIDSGLQHSLPLGYSQDPELRTALMRIMTNVLNQGAAFDDLERLKESQKQSKLVELVGNTNDFSLALSMSQVCRAWDSEGGIDRILLSIFDSGGGVIRFLKAAVEEEIESTPSDGLVFRPNSFRTHLLLLFARTHGYEYLRSIMTPLITDMANKAMEYKSMGCSFEIDPRKLESGETASGNQQRLEQSAQAFINAICDSAHQVPAVMRELCRHIRIVMDRKFPGSRYQGVGGFMFLRFLTPAIVAPENIDMNLDGPGKELRRGLMLVSKILQTLASNNLFSAHKEPFMIGLNDFLRSNVWRVTTFLDGISDARTDPDRLLAADQPLGYGIHPLGYGISETEQQQLHKWLYDNIDKVGSELLTRAKQVDAGDAAKDREAAANKRTYDELCVILAEQGKPSTDGMTVTVPNFTGHRNQGNPQQVKQDFYRRTSSRNVRDEIYKKIFYEGPPSKAGRPVLYYNPNLQDAETMDIEGLLAHIIQVMASVKGPEFDVLTDATMLKKSNLMPPQWSMFFASVIPKELACKIRNHYLFNPNAMVKIWYNSFRAMSLSAFPETIQLAAKEIQVYHANSLPELDAYIERRNVALNPQTIAIVTSVPEHRFTQITMVWYYRQLIPVTFKIGGDHLQITALKGQEIMPGRSANSNDIFHLADIDDVRSVSIRGDDNTFFLTCHGGEVAFLFNSRERVQIVEALREARARVSRIRSTRSLDRTLLPSDVPGTLLNMAMLNITSEHQALRMSAYNLLCALSTSFNFGASAARKRLLSSKGLALPGNTMGFVAELSREFAIAAPGVTLEFFVSFFEGFAGAAGNQKVMCLHYMSPWLSNLCMFTHTPREQQAEYQKRIKEVFVSLLSITTKQPELFAVMQRTVWAQISKLDDLIPLFLDVFTEAAIDSGLYTPHFDAVVNTMVSFSSMNLRGKLLSRLRKFIAKTAHSPTVGSLHENAVWKEIATLVRMNMLLSFTGGRLEALVYLPESLHIILLLAGNGVDATRYAIRGTAINLVHSLCTEDYRETSRKDTEEIPNKEALERLLERLTGDEAASLFGLPPSTDSDVLTMSSSDVVRPVPDNAAVAKLAGLVYEIAELAAPTVDTANSWRSRLTSLVTSTAFQYNPIVQSRAFILLGCLAKGEIDDDLLYQILVSLRGAITEWANLGKGGEGPLISIVTCLGKVVKILPEHSRYLAQMFWLGAAMVQYGHVQLFSAGVELMHASIDTLHERRIAEDAGTDLLELLMESRYEIRDAASRLDDETGIDFNNSFSFSMAALLCKGLRHPSTKDGTIALLQRLLECSAVGADGLNRSAIGQVSSVQLGFFVALLPTATRPEAFGELLSLAGVPQDVCRRGVEERGFSGDGGLFKYLDVVDNKSALLIVALVTSLLSAAENEPERLLLYGFLADAGHYHAAILSIMYESLAAGMREVLINSQSRQLLEATQAIVQTAVFEPIFNAQATETAQRGGPSAFLEEAGFAALLDCATFPQHQPHPNTPNTNSGGNNANKDSSGGGTESMSDARRLIMATLSTALLASLIDAGTM
ncbi:unnamed protein product [Sympodiomycopsis kandeliae]